MSRVFASFVFVVLICIQPALAEKDVIFDALTDEMKRTKEKLKFESHPTPYFVSYHVKQVDEVELSSVLGSRADLFRKSSRVVYPDIRIGDYNLDSSNPMTKVSKAYEDLPLGNDYKALRRSLWKASDHDYKFAIRTLEWKKAYLSNNNVPDRLPDLAKQKPVVALNKVKPISLDETKWKKNIEALSALFKNYPHLQKSKVMLVARVVSTWYVNTEGSKVRDSIPRIALRMYAQTQAKDGMKISNYDVVAVQTEEQMPGLDELKSKVNKFASQLTTLSKAKKAKDYCGPVLFKGQAAASFFSQVMAPNLGFAEDYVGSEKFRNPLKNTIGRKLFPPYMTVIDNPRAKSFNGLPLVGGFNFDDQGIPGEKVTLIEDGRLKAFCRSRIPTRAVNGSNGHSFGGHGVTNLVQITSQKTVSADEMTERIKDAAQDAGLDHILVIEKLDDNYLFREIPSKKYKKFYYDTPSYSVRPSAPIVAYYQFVDDGRKEFLRGLEFNYVSLRAFRDIQAVGADAAPYMVEPSDYWARHIVTPSYLIGELDLRPVKPEHETPPIVPNPLSNYQAVNR